MIKVENLSKKYDSVYAINKLNFSINKGEIIGFLGPNGAGKSTTMKILTCFMPPTEGTAKIKGFSIHEHSYEVRKLIGYLPENNPLYEEIGVFDYLKFIAEIRKIPNKAIKNRIASVVEKCQLEKVIHKDIFELSKGYRQRLGLAQALLDNPEILILDEPTIGLDPNQIIGIRNLITELGKQTTIILCSHILSEVEQICSRVFILNNGQIVADGNPADLAGQMEGEKLITIQVNQDYSTIESALCQLPELKHIEHKATDNQFTQCVLRTEADIREKIFDLSVAKNWKLRELLLEQTTLEDIFRELTKEK